MFLELGYCTIVKYIFPSFLSLIANLSLELAPYSVLLDLGLKFLALVLKPTNRRCQRVFLISITKYYTGHLW